MKVKLFGYVFSIGKDTPTFPIQEESVISFEKFKNLKIENPVTEGNWFIDNEGFATWNEWYKAKHRPIYISYQIFQLSKFPKVFESFLKSVSDFNWKEIADYMESLNWTWHNEKKSPSMIDMQNAVLDLLCSSLSEYEPFSDDVNSEGWSSGGFTVSIIHNQVYIEFDKELIKSRSL